MNEKKRTHLDIVYDILIVMRDKNGPIVPTHLLYKSNLSHDRLKCYMQELVSKGFVEEVADKSSRKRYKLKDDGLRFLANFGQMREFTQSFGL